MEQGSSGLEKARVFFGLNASMLAMLVMAIVLGLGEKMGERFLPVYMLAIGGSAYAVGSLNALDNFLSAIYSYIGGYVSDWLGYKKALVVYTCIAMLGYLIIIIFPIWQAVFVGSIFFISWTALSLPAILSLISATVKQEKQTMGVTLHSLIRRIPMALGPVLGGVFITLYGITTGARISFAIAFLLGIFALWFIHRYIEDQNKEAAARPRIRDSFINMPRQLRILLLSDILVRFAEQIPYAFVVVWVMKNNAISAASFSLLTVIEMVTAILIYIPVAWLAEKTSSKLCVTITFVFFSIFPLVLLYSTTMPVLIFAFIVRGLKEFGEPTRKALIVKLAPAGNKASVFGTYYLLRDIVVALAALSSAFLWNISPATNFITASFFGLAGTVLFIFFGSDNNSADVLVENR
ncbi:MAG: MFS transporter [Sedimentisphaerales bacterium]|nr:MFS transporter [Sedimentisphaerales bacterium]